MVWLCGTVSVTSDTLFFLPFSDNTEELTCYIILHYGEKAKQNNLTMKDPSTKKDGKRLKKQRTDKDKYKTNSKMADTSPIT